MSNPSGQTVTTNESMDDEPTTVETATTSSVLHRYQDQLTVVDESLALLRQKDQRMGYVRVALFLLFLMLGFVAAFAEASTVFGWLAVGAFGSFLVAVIVNEPIRDEMDRLVDRRKVMLRLIARVNRDWGTLDDLSPELDPDDLNWPENQRAVATDLDLFGKASLFRFVSMTHTVPGTRELAQWIAGPALERVSDERFRAAETLAPQQDERLRFYALARLVSQGTGDPSRFAEWASGPVWLSKRPALMIWANVSALIAVVLILLTAGGFLGFGPDAGLVWFRSGGLGLLSLAIINLLIGALVLAPVHEIFSIAMASRQSVADYSELFRFAETLPIPNESESVDSEGLLVRLRRRLLEGDSSASDGMMALRGVAVLGGLKQSASTFLLYLPLQVFGLWDVRVLKRLEAWQGRYGAHCKDWFKALGELEALMSLAAVHQEQPHWSAPEWTADSKEGLASVQLGHPLLPDGQRVCNDADIGPVGSFLLVTGSNMSGKSTLLRSIGLNAALAAAGGRVCADRFRLPSLELATSIRVTDSLADGVSFYMAELNRLKSVVEHARSMRSQTDRVSFFLLDEILQGTNSRERQIAVARVLSQLLDMGAIGAISTHDLELADEPVLMRHAETVHFRETITTDADGNDQMTFDYQMRQGVSPTTNALRLLEIVGLGNSETSDG
ncbi:MAG: MutS family DNA mismatch repair protein [Planctomycetota bacterium]